MSMSIDSIDAASVSNSAYPKRYAVKGIIEQANILRMLFPGVGYADERIAERTLPPGAEGWFAIPRWETFAATYTEALERVLTKLSLTRRFRNYRAGQLGSEYLNQSVKTCQLFQRLGQEQKCNDILVVPAQFGLRHQGRSVQRARWNFMEHEFDLGVFAVSCMLLTHPERMVHWPQLQVVSAGDENKINPADGFATEALVFFFYANELRLHTRGVEEDIEDEGVVTGFLPPDNDH